jgi:hypothetical protein
VPESSGWIVRLREHSPQQERVNPASDHQLKFEEDIHKAIRQILQNRTFGFSLLMPPNNMAFGRVAQVDL